MLSWRSIPLDARELSLARVLRCGQSFRWKNIDGVWSIGMRGRVVFLRQTETELHYSALPESALDSTLDIVRDYLNLDVKLGDLYEQWSASDAHFLKKSGTFAGVRILRQDPWENLCSFICSSNNNIKRISQMVENLCTHYGTPITSYQGIDYFDFPTPLQLSGPKVEEELRGLGFGYRAKYIHRTAQAVSARREGLQVLIDLRAKPYAEAHEALLEYTGVGPKVADCVCLMSLDKHDVVPVDTHVWQIAQRDYKFGRQYKTLNKVAYAAVGDYFRKLWGPYAGWAHSVLFAADLRDLNNGVNSASPLPSEAETLVKEAVVDASIKEESPALETKELSTGAIDSEQRSIMSIRGERSSRSRYKRRLSVGSLPSTVKAKKEIKVR